MFDMHQGTDEHQGKSTISFFSFFPERGFELTHMQLLPWQTLNS